MLYDDIFIIYSENNKEIIFHEKDATVSVLPRVIEYYQTLGYEFLPYSKDLAIDKMFFNF